MDNLRIMKELFVIDQEKLFNMTRVIARTIPDKAIIPAHEYIRITSIEDGMIEVFAGNAENNTAVAITGVQYSEPFSVAIEHSFLKPLKKREVDLTFSLDNNRCIITCVNSRWEVPVMPVEDIPEIKHDWQPLTQIDGLTLKEVMEAITPFAYSDETASISNIHFKSENGKLSIGASNRFSCGCYAFDMKENTREVSFMISKETCELISNIIDVDEISVYMGGDKAMRFVSGWGTVTSMGHVFENNPVNNYHLLSQRYIDREHDVIKVIDKLYFKEQIRKAAAFSPADKRMLMVDILDSKLHMQVEDYMAGRKSEQDIDILLEREGTASKFIVAYGHLLKVIANTQSLGIDIEIPKSNGEGMTTIKEPLVIQDNGYVFLVMPLSA